MCLVSDKIKFCTCVSGSVNKLQHYWIWHHYVNGSMETCLGLSMMPTSLTDPNFIINETTMCEFNRTRVAQDSVKDSVSPMLIKIQSSSF